jgi:hypothetical protein
MLVLGMAHKLWQVDRNPHGTVKEYSCNMNRTNIYI